MNDEKININLFSAFDNACYDKKTEQDLNEKQCADVNTSNRVLHTDLLIKWDIVKENRLTENHSIVKNSRMIKTHENEELNKPLNAHFLIKWGILSDDYSAESQRVKVRE